MNPLLTLSGSALARKIKAGEVTSREVVEAHIAHIQAVNPKLNALVAYRYEMARHEADHADAHLQAEGPENLPPFHGVPCSIKEAFALQGMPNTSGLVSRRGVVAEKDATAVARYKGAGAIPLGVTNTSELCMWMESFNRVYGRTNNPYHLDHTAGGSSGGEGALIGAAGVPFGLGSDVGGSIRMPAFFNGIFGHKPTGGLIPNTGQHPALKGPKSGCLTTGPMCRKAEDLWPLIQVLAGKDGEDEVVRDWELGDPTTVDLSKLRVFTVESNNFSNVSDELLGRQRQVADWFQAQGCPVETHNFPHLQHSFEIWSAMLHDANEDAFVDLLKDGQHRNFFWELLSLAVGRSEHTLPGVMLALTEDVPHLIPGRTRKMVRLGEELREEMLGLLGDDGIILYPSYVGVAPKHVHALFPFWNFVYTGILNMMEVPVTQVPLGLNRQGLPTGVQVIAGRGQDHLAVAAALALEEQFGGWVAPGIARQAAPEAMARS